MVQRFGITLTQLSYFAECARTLNMTLASQELHVAQSAVSTAISHLERSLETTLFVRQHSKGLVLTPAGEMLLRDSQQLFGLLGDTVDRLRSDRDEVRGSITIACFNTLAPFYLPPLLAKLQDRHPGLQLTTIEGDHEEYLAALRGGRAEIGLGYSLTEADDVASEVVGEVRPHVLVDAEHPLASRKTVALAELAEDPFVLLDLPDSSSHFMSLLRHAGVTPRLKFRTPSYETVRSMVAMKLGFSLLHQRPRIAETYSGARTVTLEISDDVPALRIMVSSPKQVQRSARANAVAAAAREVLAESAAEQGSR
ncbi:LysR family transcriptional regulator [Leucobacter sp. USHLN153]|uniref:LysR family transcriptional regulator n=1 Tax=Leucobacter sp. USHLN153 TaxID=3081268 RepID=UPI00301A7239